MVRIPLPDRIAPGALQGDRLSTASPDLAGPGRALAGLGSALQGLAERDQAERKQMDAYKTNLALERWSTDQTLGYAQDLEQSAQDGGDFLQKREENLRKSYASVAAGIKDPEQRMRADLIFEQTLGNQKIKGYGDVKAKRKSFVIASTDDGVNRAVETGQIQSEEQYQDYFENVIKPKIDSVIADPLDRQAAYETFGKKLGTEYLRRNPQVALPKAMGDEDYLARLAQIESGGNPYAQNDSGASGLFQFMPGTAKDYGLANPFDPVASTVAARRLTADNAAYLRKALGREPRPGELYLAHQQGAKGAAALLANPEALAVDVLGEQPVMQNGGAPGMTAGQFAQKWIGKFEGTAPAQMPVMTPAKPTEGMWRYVSDEDWGDMSKAAHAADIDRRKAQDEQDNLAKDELVKGGIDLLADDKLTAQWLEDNRDNLTPAEYRTFSNALEKQDGLGNVTDRVGYLSFLQRASEEEDQGAVQDDAIKAFSDGDISKTDFNKIISLSKSTEKHRTDKPWLGDIRRTLSSQLAPLDREDTEQYANRLDGLFALDDWIALNPQAGRDEVKKKANEIRKQYSESEDLRSGLDMPKYTTVGRYAMTPDAIAIAAQKLLQSYREGKIGREELNRETELLKKWKAALDEEARAGQ